MAMARRTQQPRGTLGLAGLRPALHWRARCADRVLGREALGHAILTDADAESDPFTVFNPVRGRFEEVTAGSKDALGICGEFCDGSVIDYWQAHNADNRGFIHSQAVTLSNPTLDDDWIVQHSLISNKFQVLAGVGWPLLEKPMTASDTYTRQIGALVRRTNGQSVPGFCVPYATSAQNSYPNNRVDTGRVFYEKVPNRADGWWWVWTHVPPQDPADVNVHAGLALVDGAEYQVEAPQNIGFYSGFANVPRSPILDTSGGGPRSRGQYYVDVTDQNGAADQCFGEAGWLALSLSLPFPSTYTDEDGVADIPHSCLLSWEKDANNYLKVIVSDSAERIVVWLVVGGTTEAYLEAPATWFAFEPIGIAVVWGAWNQTRHMALAVNGHKVEADVAIGGFFDRGEVRIGADSSGSSAADAWIEQVAIGHQARDRVQARALSRHMRDQVQVANADGAAGMV